MRFRKSIKQYIESFPIGDGDESTKWTKDQISTHTHTPDKTNTCNLMNNFFAIIVMVQTKLHR